ncbi:MAG TPA: GNAT family N-acetyltransferase [Candidatus Eisenbergiella merdipullorum]|uniref:GNAT family N-acetyltransferase n=1 Tax=Candidatus Eisenbergiella merdipullorum TaxID=2838553 RepID=A0A9D2L145_9FIRM|nr:GNAT family N-acetyltransferase [Candidatus Eisenbergiella merdipullorum]
MDLKVMRATETWQQAGAYYVRVQAMARKYHITLREEFDEHDTPSTKYIVLLDGEFPVATCRLYEMQVRDGEAPSMMLGRVVVLPEYRKQGLGSHAVTEAEKWARELGSRTAVLDSRDVAVGFYEKLGYVPDPDRRAQEDTFPCIPMKKALD